MTMLNLGAGKKLLPKYSRKAINADITKYPGIDQVVDLSKFPWPWADKSFTFLQASHVMEHIQDQEKFLAECIRVLEPGGKLRIVGPHSSCVTSVGCLGHYRTYSYNTFHDYLSKPFYMFKTAQFKTTYQKLNWWYETPDAEKNLSKWMLRVIKIIDPVMNYFIKLSPRVFENVFCSFIQCREIVWEGVKI